MFEMGDGIKNGFGLDIDAQGCGRSKNKSYKGQGCNAAVVGCCDDGGVGGTPVIISCKGRLSTCRTYLPLVAIGNQCQAG